MYKDCKIILKEQEIISILEKHFKIHTIDVPTTIKVEDGKYIVSYREEAIMGRRD